jgi:hypothetical protein
MIKKLDLSSAQKGKLAELYFEIECVKRRIEISRPVIGLRYDYVAFIEGAPRRVQVKWADRRIGHGCIELDLGRPRGIRNANPNKGVALYTKEEIDLVFAYLPSIERFLVLGPEIFHERRQLSFRTHPALNRQKAKIRNASEFFWK